jgi:hypothetical protein
MRSHSGVGDDENVDVDPDINPSLTRSMVSHSVHHRHDSSRPSEPRRR